MPRLRVVASEQKEEFLFLLSSPEPFQYFMPFSHRHIQTQNDAVSGSTPTTGSLCPCCPLSWASLFTFHLGALFQGGPLISYPLTVGKLKPLVQSQ